ncbi:IS3 family transposase [Bacillus sp. FJAT-45066]|uniref:IS3 family transposase n=1 Tax=Bacillus sp. FJAT-45066 TaxID=2011010 RepID=UPI0020D1770A|nr:IS3 family transposase [Bacillus sp. FJAT-45066]
MFILCRVLEVSVSGYYAYLKRPKKKVSHGDKELFKKISNVFKKHKGTFGAKRIAGYMKNKMSIIVNHKKVARLMKEANMKATVRQKNTTKTEKQKAAGYVYNNLLERDFNAEFPNQKWVTDMTEIKVFNTKFYISALMDLFNREVIAFEISFSPDTELIKRTIEAGQKQRQLKDLEGVTIHSDQGSVYRSFEHNKLSRTLKFTPSMSRKGNCWDNAVIESFFSQLKVEFPCFYPNTKKAIFEKDLKKYIMYYNEERIQKGLGYDSPKEYYKEFIKVA